ncbi:hypothetical protein JCM10207_008289 [Rhodosporidiobolus poonsookiae]
MPPSFGEYADEKAVVEQFEQIEQVEKQIDPQAEKRLLRKLDLVLLPQVTLLFLLNFIDRAAVGNANVAGFSTDLKLSVPKYEYNVALMVFYIFYIVGEIPSNLILKKIGSMWLAFLCVAFGVVTIGSAFIHNFGEFLAVRIFLGIVEGGVIPGIAYVMTLFYRRHELAFRIGVFLSLGPGLSGAFGGLLAAGFLNSTIGTLHTWQKIFAMEGTITAAFGIIFFFTLPSSPETTRWLNEDERKVALQRLQIEHLGQTHEKTTARGVFKAIFNPFTWAATLGYIFINVIVQGTSLFLPTIIAGLGKYTTTETQLRTVPPYVVASAWSVFISYFAWKTRRHGIFVACSCIFSVIGYAMFLGSKNSKVLYGASFLTFTGALPCGPFFLAWATANSGTPTARAVTAAIVPAWGSIGSMICTWIYLPKYKPRYIPGNSFNIACSIGAATTALCMLFYCRWENKQRIAGRRDNRIDGKTEEEIKALGHRHPAYRLME